MTDEKVEEAKKQAERAGGWFLLLVAGLVVLVGLFLAISGVGTAFGLPIVILGVIGVWAAWKIRPRKRG